MAVVLFTLPLLGAVTLGESIAVLGTIASFLLNHPHQQQPTFKAMTSCWGDPWAITYNNFRVAGKVIQASPVTKHSAKKSKKGGPTYSQTICIGFGEGPRSIGRIWADGQVIYDPRPITPPDSWAPNTDYGAGDIVLPTAGGSWQFIATITAASGGSEPSWNSSLDASTADGSQVWIAAPYVPRTFIGQKYDFNMRIYTGTETQLPDSALEELVGVGNQSAYRGLINIVLEDFDISRYGNRIPNIEAELMGANAIAFDSSGEYFGQFATNLDFSGPFLADDVSNVYGINANNGGYVIKMGSPLTATLVDTARCTADAASFGWPHGAFPSGLMPIAGKYFCSVWRQTRTLSTDDYGILLYQIETDGSVTAIGLKEYQGIYDIGIAAVGVSPTTGQVMIAGSSFSSANVGVAVFDTIADIVGPYAIQGNPGRSVSIGEIYGNYGGAPGPYLGYSLAFVGDTLYCTLNEAHMFFTTYGGLGNNPYYASLEPTYPQGALVRIDLQPTLSGFLTYIFRGPGTDDFGWPFSDEGETLAGTPGNFSGSGTYDCWSPPCQVQTATGVVQQVIFSRGYSDVGADNLVGLKQFEPSFTPLGLPTFAVRGQISGAPFGAFSNPDLLVPRAYLAGGDIYMNFDSAALERYARVGAFIPTNLTLADICADISDRVGLAGKYDFSGLTSVVPHGAAVLNRQKAREFLEAMFPAFFYDLTDIGAQVIGTLRVNSALVATIQENDLGAATDPNALLDKISSTRSADLEIPRDMAISYYDLNHDYQGGSQPARRSQITQYSSGSNSLNIPVVMSAGEAANVASRVLYQTWIERTPRKVSVPLDYIYLTPADIIDVVRGGETYRMRITKARFNPTQVIDLEGVSEDLGVYSLTAGNPLADIGTGSFIPGTVKPIVTPVLAILDTAPLRDTDVQEIGIYAAGCPAIFAGGFDGESVQASVDNSVYDQQGVIEIKSTIGTAVSILADYSRWTVWDRINTLDVTLLDGALGNASEADMIDNLVNLCWSSTGEIFQFKTATLISGQTYRLSTLLRGRYGTESFTGAHTIGEQIVAIDTSAGVDITYYANRIGQAIYWKGVNDAATGNETTPQLLTMTTRRLMPFAPYFLRGSRDGSNNLTITGLRRMRWRGRPLWTPPETDTPITVEIDIFNGLSKVRTLTSTLSGAGSGITDASAFTAYYAAADQVADFGSTQAAISIIAYQLNAVVGRGYGGTGTV